MSKGLDLFQRQQIEVIDGYPTGNVYVGLTIDELAELEKEFEALEIIKRKRVDVYKLSTCFEKGSLERYNSDLEMSYFRERHLTQEQFDLLKKALS